MASIYLTIHNPTDSTLHLTTVSVDGVMHSTFHESRETAGMAHMADLSEVVIPAHDSLQLRPRALHVMAHGLPRALAVRDSIRVDGTHQPWGGAYDVRARARRIGLQR